VAVIDAKITALEADIVTTDTEITTLKTEISSAQTGLESQIDSHVSSLEADINALNTAHTNNLDQVMTDHRNDTNGISDKGAIKSANEKANFRRKMHVEQWTIKQALLPLKS